MENSDNSNTNGLILFSLVAVIDVIVDQLSKAWIRSNIPFGESYFQAGFFRIIDIRNTGAAFGLFQGGTAVLAVLSVLAAIAILLFAFFVRHRFSFLHTGLGRVTLGLILGGIVGNMLDRVRLDYVTDFLDFTYWPTFNVADASVVVGIILLAYCLLFRYKD
jgi:signal peptidase II